MEIAIIGGLGNIGRIVASHLGNAGHNIIIVDPFCEHLKEEIKICGAVDIKYKPHKLYKNIADIPKNVKHIIIATKATFLEDIATELKKINNKEIKYLIAQNGLGNEEFLCQKLETDNVARLIINFIGTPSETGTVMRWLSEKNYVGSAKAKETALFFANLFTNAGLPTDYLADYKKEVWEKVLKNSTLSPICAIYNLTMEQATIEKYQLVLDVLTEGITVAKEDGFDFSDRKNEFLDYLKRGGKHKPSMLQDVERKTATEIEWVNGAIIKIAKEFGINVPINKEIVRKIKKIEVGFK